MTSVVEHKMVMPWKGLVAMSVLLVSALLASGAVALGPAPLWQKWAFPPLAFWASIYASVQAIKFEITAALGEE